MNFLSEPPSWMRWRRSSPFQKCGMNGWRWFSSTMLLSTRRAMHTELRVNHRGSSSSSGYKHQQAQAKHYQTVSCKKFQDLESQVLNSAVIDQDLGTLSCKHVTFQNLACQVLKELCKISDLWLPSLDNHFHLCSCLGRPSHERHKSWLYCWKSIQQKVSRLGKPSLE